MIFTTGASSENVDDIVSLVFNTYLGTVEKKKDREF
jgi:hypothetical protein